MSLLMDALKRAEKAREAQAEKADADDAAESPSAELSLDPIDEIADPPLPAADPTMPTGPSTGSGTGTGSSTEDSLELTPDDIKRQIESLEDSAVDELVGGLSGDPNGGLGGLDLQESQPLPVGGEKLDDSMSLEYGDIPLDETGSTLPSMRSAQASVQDYFDGTHSMSMSMEEVRENLDFEGRDGAPVNDTQGSAGAQEEGNTTAQRRAQAVLDASVGAPSNTGRTIGLLILLLLFLGVAGGGLFLFKDRLIALLDVPPPLVAQGQPATTSAVAPTSAPTTGLAASDTSPAAAALQREAMLRAAEQARAEEATRAQALADAETKINEQAQQQAQAAADAAAAQIAEAQARIEELEAAAAADRAAAATRLETALASANRNASRSINPPASASATTPAGAAERTSLTTPSAFKVSKRRGPGRIHKELVKAFEAFQAGEDGHAMQHYTAVLKREPRNRDAMLGVAAISMRSGATTQAARYYTEILRRNPRDGAAQAGLIALQDNVDPVSAESRINGLLARTPNDANLHFSLGNVYADQSLWSKAQQSYFEAFKLDSTNPDYAFNLAVALDQLSQSKPALEYYRRAEELATRSPAAFESAVARRRVAELAGS